jgi:polo-like kinase 4
MLKKNINKEVLTEIKIHFYLRHPNIVQLYHVYQDADYLYLLMEFAQESLFALLKNHKLEGKAGKEHWVVGILEQIIRAVQYMHREGIVHGDLKLENILLTEVAVFLSSEFGEDL